MTVQPYLFFNGRCEEALDFYRDALGAKVQAMMRFGENPEPSEEMGDVPKDKVMHACFSVGDTNIMASDGCANGKPSFDGFALSLSVPDAAAAERQFAVLAKDGTVQMPLAKTFFSPSFGMVADRFGVLWMVIVPPADAP